MLIGELPADAATRPRQAARPVGGERVRRGARRADRRRGQARPAGSPTGSSRCTNAGAAWSDCAVLCRTSRLFLSLQQAFNERGVPAEILGLAGLLKIPEVVEVLAYARATLDPLASVALGRILLGPRYRVGFKDLALVASLAKDKSYALREEDEVEGEAAPFLFAEALEHLDEVEGLSDEGRARLEECRQELAALRVEARRPVGEFLGEIIRRTGILTELDAQLDVASAAAARRNLAAFLDEVHAFAPIQGELTLRAFLDYVDAVENLDKQEWSPVQPSGGGLGEGDDDPRREGARVRPRLRARARERACSPTPRSSTTRRSAASRWTSSSAGTPRTCLATRGTCPPSRRTSRSRRSTRNADRLRRDDTRAPHAPRDRRPLVRGEPPRQGGRARSSAS